MMIMIRLPNDNDTDAYYMIRMPTILIRLPTNNDNDAY